MFTTRIDKELLRKLKILAVNKEKPANELIEEALKYLFKKYEKKKYMLYFPRHDKSTWTSVKSLEFLIFGLLSN